ncbi:MAG: trimeric intracellular cation channel family protein [Comamonadaceae bacterium]|nr:MAG: trimeric intracellular cation channel family protein [Comamonadaceae bacterium]
MLTPIYLVAITAEAMSGALAAGRRRMDIFGVAAIAFVTALGGGTVRDVVLGRYPVGWTQHPEYIYIVLAAGLVTTLVATRMRGLKELFLVLDAMGLIAFSLIGCGVARGMGYPVAVVIMAGLMTGIAGGIVRDVLCNQVPVVFRRELYASVSLLACALYLALLHLGIANDTSTAITFFAGMALRLAAIRQGWRLPSFSHSERWD